MKAGIVRPRLPSRFRASTLLVGGTGALVAVVAAGALVAVVAASVLSATGQARQAPSQARHSPPPMARPFTLARLGEPGKQLTLASYAGRAVIINFFASWCGPCQQETPLLAKFYRSHHGQVLVIGIDANDKSGQALGFLRGRGVSYPVAFDPSASVTVSYGIVGLPQTIFLNARHQIVRHVFGALTAAELNSWAVSLPHRNGAS